MAKNWIKIDTIYSLKNSPETKEEQRRKSKLFKSMMSKIESLPVSEMKKRSVELYNKHKEEENKLLQAYEDKKLKSEKAIKQAIRIKKERAKLKNSAKQDKEKVSKTTETTESTV